MHCFDLKKAGNFPGGRFRSLLRWIAPEMSAKTNLTIPVDAAPATATRSNQ